MSSGNEPKPFRGNVLYSRKLEATEPLYGDLNRIGTVQVKSAAPARSRRNARSRTEAFSSWYGVNTQMPAEMTALATRAAIPTQLAAGARGRGAIVHARDLRMASSDLRSVASSNYWRQGVGVIGPGLAVAARVSGALASRGSGSGRPNATKSFERPIGPRLQQSRREGPGAGRTALLTAAARRPTRAGPFAPRGTAVGNVQGADVEWSTAWSERTKSVGSASRSGLSSDSLSSGPVHFQLSSPILEGRPVPTLIVRPIPIPEATGIPIAFWICWLREHRARRVVLQVWILGWARHIPVALADSGNGDFR